MADSFIKKIIKTVSTAFLLTLFCGVITAYADDMTYVNDSLTVSGGAMVFTTTWDVSGSSAYYNSGYVYPYLTFNEADWGGGYNICGVTNSSHGSYDIWCYNLSSNGSPYSGNGTSGGNTIYSPGARIGSTSYQVFADRVEYSHSKTYLSSSSCRVTVTIKVYNPRAGLNPTGIGFSIRRGSSSWWVCWGGVNWGSSWASTLASCARGGHSPSNYWYTSGNTHYKYCSQCGNWTTSHTISYSYSDYSSSQHRINCATCGTYITYEDHTFSGGSCTKCGRKSSYYVAFNKNEPGSTSGYTPPASNAQIVHSSNLGSYDSSSTGYGNNLANNNVVTIPGASSLKVTVIIQTESTSYDWLCLYQGTSVSPSASNYSSSYTGKIGGPSKQKLVYTIPGNTVQVFFKTDSSVDYYYGYWVVVEDAANASFNAPITSGNTMGSQYFTYGTAQNLYSNTYSVTGYTFAGWATSPTGSVAYSNGQYVNNLMATNGGTFNLYAKWTPITYTTIFNVNKPSNATNNPTISKTSESCTYDVAKTLPTGSLTGWSLSGWSLYPSNGYGTGLLGIALDGVGGPGESYKNLTITNGDTVNLYATWTPNTYYVSYDKNDSSATGSMSTSTHLFDTDNTLSSCGFSKTGYSFAGWTTSASGNVAYSNGQSVNLTTTNGATVTLYAKWQKNSYTVRYDQQGGNSGSQTATATYDTAMPSITKPVRTGYSFAGYYSVANGGGTKYYNADGSSARNCDFTATTTLYAYWTPNSYALSFDKQNGTGGSDGATAVFGNALPSVTIPTRTGYDFLGYYSSANGGGTQYYSSNGTSAHAWDIAANTTLYACWSSRPYYVAYNGNKPQGSTGTVTDVPATVTWNYDTISTLGSTPVLAGWTFTGWYKEANCTTRIGGAGESLAAANLTDVKYATINLYAGWTRNIYSVAFDKTSGVGDTMPAQTHIYDQSLELSNVTYTKEGYHFDHWSRNSDGSGTTFENRESVTNLTNTAGSTVTLYANWEANSYKVAFDGNGATSGSTATQNFTYDVAQNLRNNGFSRTGYTFAGWKLKQNSASIDFENQGSAKNLSSINNATVMLYAAWTKNSYTVTLSNAPGTGSVTSVTATYDTPMPTLASLPSRTGYVFYGYYSEAGGSGTKYYDASGKSTRTWNVASDTTLYAYWVPATYTVSFDCNKPAASTKPISNEPANATWTYDTSSTLPSAPVIEGWTFVAWYRDVNLQNILGTAGATVDKANLTATAGGSATVYAKWRANGYSIRFNANDGGTGTMGNQSFTFDTDAKALNSCTFVKTGYHFLKWNTNASGAGTDYADKQPIQNLSSIDGAVVDLYSFFEVNPYTINFDANTGSGTMASKDMIYDVASTLPSNTFTKTGYHFLNWNTKANGTGTTITDGASVSKLTTENHGTVTLYAQWTPIHYNLVFHANTASGTMTSQTVAYDANVKIKANGFTKEGYTFAGWALSADDDATYSDQENIENLSSVDGTTIDLYAKWSTNPYYVDYYGNGSTSGSMVRQAFTYDTEQPLAASGYLRTGYHQLGWSVSASSSVVSYTLGQRVLNLSATLHGVVSLYAVWEKNNYEVAYDPGDGGGMPAGSAKTRMDNLLFQYDDANGAQPLSKNLYQKTGYHFIGWYDELNDKTYGDEEAVFNLTSVKDGVVTLVAQWAPNAFTVKFNSNGATEGTDPEDMSFIYDVAQKLPAMPYTKTGYAYRGFWRTNAEGTGISYTEASLVKNLTTEKDGVVTLYAQWRPHTYSIQYSGNGATSGEMPTQVFTYNLRENLNKNQFARTGYFWTGWQGVVNGATVKKTDEASIYNLVDTDGTIITFTAQWTPVTYTVAYDGNKPDAATGTVTLIPESQTFTFDSSTDALGCKPILTGWNFGGWYLDPECEHRVGDAEEVLDAPNLCYIDQDTVTLYAKWERQAYEVEYHGNKPSNATSDVTNISENKQWHFDRNERLAAAPLLTGWTFAGWYLDAACSDLLGSATEELTKPNLTETEGAKIPIYAGWTANTYTVTFNPNEGTTPTASKVVTYDSPYGDLPNPTRTGYSFAGWYTDKDGGDRIYSTTNVTILSNRTLYAHWNPKTYMVTLITEGATSEGTTAFYYLYAQKKVVGTETCYYFNDTGFTNPLPQGKNIVLPVRTGYTFHGYYTQGGGAGTQYVTANGVIEPTMYSTVASNTTLYAYWTPNSYKIKYNECKPENATAEVTNMTAGDTWTYDDNSTLAKAPELTGWIFDGWYRDPEYSQFAGNALQNLANANYSATNGATVNLYAKWHAAGYDIRFVKGSEYADDVTMPNQHFTYDIPQALDENLMTREGYLFDGWSYEEGGEVDFVDQEEILNLTSTNGAVINLYAVWKANAYYIRFDGNGSSSGTMGLQAAVYDTATNLRRNQFRKTGYTFSGWLNDDGTIYHDTEVVVNLTNASGGTATLVAQWTPNTYNVVFNKNSTSATGTMTNQVLTYDLAAELKDNSFTRAGYIFEGWNRRSDLTGTFYLNKASVQNLSTIQGSNVSLFAQWGPVHYKVLFDANITGATGSMDYMTLTYDERANLSENQFAKVGYSFKYWASNPDGTGKIYADKASVLNLADTDGEGITLYAQWKPHTYEIEFRKNDSLAEGSMAAESFTYDVEKALTNVGFTKTGYSFDKWTTDPEGTMSSYQNKEKILNLTAEDKKVIGFYAQWKPNTYTVAFDPNGGTGTAPSSVTMTYDDYDELPANTFTRKGYVFKSWNTKPDGTGKSIEDTGRTGNLTTVNGATVTLYAQWDKIQYTIVFDGNGATTGKMESITMTYEQSKSLPANLFTRVGYDFNSWNTKADGTGSKYMNMATVADMSLEDGAEVKLFATWTAHNYTVTFDLNGGTGAIVPDISTKYGTEFTAPDPSLTKSGHDFTGWNTKANGTGTFYEKGSGVKNLSIVKDATVTLYAYYKPYGYTIRFDANGGTGTMKDLNMEFSVAKTLTTNTLKREGYKFAGWNTKADGTGTRYSDGQSVKDLSKTKDAVVTLYARWVRNSYKIAFDSNGGTGAMQTIDVSFDEIKSLPLNEFTRSGFSFEGWSTTKGGSGKCYEDGESVKDLGEKDGDIVTLYAQWTGVPHEINYQLNGASWADGFSPSTTFYTDETFVLPTSKDMKFDGYVFLGWYTTPSMTGTSIVQIPEGSDNITVYASWYDVKNRRKGVSPVVRNDYSVDGE